MAALTIECLRCGETRPRERSRRVDDHECRRCGYVGWASSDALSETQRRSLRERPVERRRLRVA